MHPSRSRRFCKRDRHRYGKFDETRQYLFKAATTWTARSLESAISNHRPTAPENPDRLLAELAVPDVPIPAGPGDARKQLIFVGVALPTRLLTYDSIAADA